MHRSKSRTVILPTRTEKVSGLFLEHAHSLGIRSVVRLRDGISRIRTTL